MCANDFEEAILTMELPKRHTTLLAGSPGRFEPLARTNRKCQNFMFGAVAFAHLGIRRPHQIPTAALRRLFPPCGIETGRAGHKAGELNTERSGAIKPAAATAAPPSHST